MPLLPLLVASVLLGVACRREASEANVYNEMLRASRERAMFVGNEFAVDEAHAMLDRAEREGSRYGKVMAYLSLSSLAAQSGDQDDLRRYMEVARASLDVADPPYLQGYAYYVEGTVDFSTTLSINALLCYDKALRYFRPLGDSLMVASCFVNKCNCYMVNKNLEGSSACLDSAKAWCPVSYGHTTRFYEAMLQSYLGQPQQAMQTYADIVAAARADSASFAFPSRASARFWALLYSNYIFSALASDSIALAEGILQEMRLLASAYGRGFDSTCCHLMEAWIVASKGDLDAALGICNDLYDNYKGFHQVAIRRQVVDLMEQCYTEKGDYRKALEFNRIKASIAPGRMADVRLLEEIVDRQQGYEHHIRSLEIRTSHTRIALILMLSLLVITVGAFLLYRKDRRLKERQARVRELENERLLLRQQSEIDSAKMEQAARREQMASFAGQVRRIASEMPKNVRSRLLQGISRMEEQQEQDAWGEFEEGFSRQYAGFLEHLAQHYPSLSPIEVKICMLIRVGLSNREVADTLHLADNTVRTYRTRIRKKLALDGGNEDLNLFLSSIVVE